MHPTMSLSLSDSEFESEAGWMLFWVSCTIEVKILLPICALTTLTFSSFSPLNAILRWLILEGLDGVNWQLTNGQNFNWQLTNRWKSNRQLTFVVGFYWQLTNDQITLNILKTECKIRTVDLLCPIKVRFLSHTSRSTRECHISLVMDAWTIHIKVICHRYMIFETRLDRQLTRWPSMLVF